MSNVKALEPRAALKIIRSRVKAGNDTAVPLSLTTKQAAVLRHCRTQVLLTGRMPTVREVQAAFELRSLSTAQFHLENLREKGLLPKSQADLYLTLAEGEFLLGLIDEKDEQIRTLTARAK